MILFYSVDNSIYAIISQMKKRLKRIIDCIIDLLTGRSVRKKPY